MEIHPEGPPIAPLPRRTSDGFTPPMDPSFYVETKSHPLLLPLRFHSQSLPSLPGLRQSELLLSWLFANAHRCPGHQFKAIRLHLQSHHRRHLQSHHGGRMQLPSICPPILRSCVSVLSAPPSDPDCMTLIIDCSSASVSVCRVHGHSEWITFPVSEPLDEPLIRARSISAIFCGGKLYCLCSGLFRVIDPLFPSPSIKPLDMECQAGHLREAQNQEAQNHYLVASNGEVLMVVVDGTGLSYDRIQDFRVFRADFSQMTWVIMKELGDRVLFVDEDFAFCLSAAEVGCKKNLIYYTYRDDYVGPEHWPPLSAWKVFDMDARGWIDGPSFPNGVISISTLWFVPSLEYVNPL